MRAESPRNPTDFDRLVDNYFDFYFQFHPRKQRPRGFINTTTSWRTTPAPRARGRLPTCGISAQSLSALTRRNFPRKAPATWHFCKAQIKGRLLELETLQMWRKDPNLYVGSVTESIFVIIKRNFAPAGGAPAFGHRPRASNSRALSRRPAPTSRIRRKSTRRSPLNRCPGSLNFFKRTSPAAFPDVKDAALWAEFQRTNAAVVKALENFQSSFKTTCFPTSQGDFRIGEENFRQKLLDDEMVNIPLDQLLQIGYADLHRNQQRLKETAALINPNASPREVLALLEKDHPAPDQLLPTFRNLLGGLREFIEAKKIVTIPSPILPILEETPPFMRATTTASMDTPGAYESRATEAMFNVTTPAARLDAAARGGLDGRLQPRHHSEHGDSRGVSRPLRSILVGQTPELQSAEVAVLQQQRGRLGALHGADDAG